MGSPSNLRRLPQMAEKTFRQELVLAVVDKLLLGAIVAIAAATFEAKLETKKRADAELIEITKARIVSAERRFGELRDLDGEGTRLATAIHYAEWPRSKTLEIRALREEAEASEAKHHHTDTTLWVPAALRLSMEGLELWSVRRTKLLAMMAKCIEGKLTKWEAETAPLSASPSSADKPDSALIASRKMELLECEKIEPNNETVNAYSKALADTRASADDFVKAAQDGTHFTVF
jgi:hypothetical protein